MSSKKWGMHFIHININSLVLKIDELRYIANITNSSIIGISETKLLETILPSELEGRWLWFNKTRSIKEVLLVTVTVTVKVRLHIFTKTVFAVTLKVFLLAFVYLNLSQSYRASYVNHPINQISLNALITLSKKPRF